MRTIKLRFTYPHPGDQYLVLCCGTLNGTWVVSTLNTQVGGHYGGEYFGADEDTATKYFYSVAANMCKRRAKEFEAAAFEGAGCWEPPDHYIDGLPPKCEE